MNKKAFTLMELLVVLVIIGIFIAVLAPAIAKGREKARQGMCLNNLRQIGIAWYMYLDEHGDRFPEYGDAGDGEMDEYSWGGKKGSWSGASSTASVRLLNSYLEIYSETGYGDPIEVFHCPSDKNPFSELGDKTAFEYYGNSYYANTNICGLSLSTLSSLSSTLCIVKDAKHFHGGEDPYYKVNVLFLDGHVGTHNDPAHWDGGEVVE